MDGHFRSSNVTTGLNAELGHLQNRFRWKHWAIPLLLALLFHILLISMHWDWLSPMTSPAPRVEVQNITPDQLAQIKKKWREKSLLLDKDKNRPKDQKVPDDARYFSDRNNRVEKEQRARQRQVIPKPGGPAEQPTKTHPKPQPKNNTDSAKNFPKLENLGIPFHFDQVKNKSTFEHDPTHAFEHLQQPMQQGGDQAILDKNLPEGSENVLNSQESIYYSFYARLYQAIAPIWQSHIRNIPYTQHILTGEYSTIVDITLDKEGNLKGIHHLYNSGITAFDDAVDSSWKKIQRFPNPPPALLNTEGEIHIGWTFTVQVDEHFGMQYAPPVRRY